MPVNPLVLGKNSYGWFNYLNNYNLLNGTGLNINITGNNRINTNNGGNNGEENYFNENRFNQM